MAPGSTERDSGISRAGGRTTVDIPLGGRQVPDIKEAPLKKGHLGRNLAVAVGALVLTAAGVGAAINSGRGTSPQPTENPGGIVEPSSTPTPTPSPTESPTVTLPPTPTPTLEATPTPEPTPDMTKWWNQIPESPYKNINEVPLGKDSSGFATGGTINTEAYPYKPNYFLSIVGATVGEVKANPKKGTVTVTLITGKVGEKINTENCHQEVVNNSPVMTFCNYTGATIRVELDKNSKVAIGAISNISEVQQGIEPIAQYLKVGEKIREVDIIFSTIPGVQNSSETSLNMESFNLLKSNVGNSQSRLQPIIFHPASFDV